MTKAMPYNFGADPITIQWTVVRGDTATLRVEFYENNETTIIDTSEWDFASSAYGAREDIIDPLEVVIGQGYIEIVAAPEITSLWGASYSQVVAELLFDLQITIDGDVWTPIVGTIKVIGDVTSGSL